MKHGHEAGGEACEGGVQARGVGWEGEERSAGGPGAGACQLLPWAALGLP